MVRNNCFLQKGVEVWETLLDGWSGRVVPATPCMSPSNTSLQATHSLSSFLGKPHAGLDRSPPKPENDPTHHWQTNGNYSKKKKNTDKQRERQKTQRGMQEPLYWAWENRCAKNRTPLSPFSLNAILAKTVKGQGSESPALVM